MRILLAVGQNEIRSALKILLEEVVEFAMVGEATNAVDLLVLAKQVQPDLVLLDYKLPIPELVELLSVLRESHPKMKVVVLSVRSEVREPALEAGADAFFSKGDHPRKLLAVLHSLNGDEQ